MTISFQLPPELEQSLRRKSPNVEGEAKESYLVAMYRQGQLSYSDLATALGVDRLTVEEILHRHGVTEDLGKIEDYLADVNTLRNISNGTTS